MLKIVCLLTLLLVLSMACSDGDEPTTATMPESQEIQGLRSSGPYDGPPSLEETILASTIVAKARLRSVSATTVSYPDYGSFIGPSPVGFEPPPFYGALSHRFDVSEYIVGTGDNHLTAIVWGGGDDTQEDAVASSQRLLKERDTQWDNRDAIIFLTDEDPQGRYALGSIWRGDRYSIDSPYWRAWLPAESGGASGASGATRTSSDSQRFLLEAPSGASGAFGASGGSGESGASTITLGGMKQKIAGLQQEIAVGDGTPEYSQCVREKYEAERKLAHHISLYGDPYRRFDRTIESGSPAGTLAYDPDPAGPPPSAPRPPGETYGLARVMGRDAHLFTAIPAPGWEYRTARPLPAGEYRFFDVYTPAELVPCDGEPEKEKYQWEIILQVTAPDGVLHEAFFDPQTLSSGDGYIRSGDLSTGDLSPAAFTTGDTTTTGDATTTGDTITITSLYATVDSVTMTLSPYNALAGHTLDFITGDGTTSLSLDADAATGDSTAGTLTWVVGSQPWSSGDELMLRITEPWFGVRVDLSPREEGSRTLTDITISWADPQTCSDGYFVALYDGDTVVRRLGYPDATTTSISNSTGMQWDSIPGRTSTARVNCTDSGWRTVGDVPLTSGLP